MSDKPLKQSNELAQVLSRINTLTQHGKDQPQSADSAEIIPQLTEIYEGEPLVFTSPAADEFPTLNKFVAPLTDASLTGLSDQGQALQPEEIERLLAEMRPLIEALVEKHARQPLRAKIETEIMQALHERLQSLS
jgi:hypothetical protein